MNFQEYYLDGNKVTIINNKLYMYLNDDGKPIKNVTIKEVFGERQKGFVRKRKDGSYMDTSKHLRKKNQVFLYRIDENSLSEKYIDVFAEGYADEEFKQIRLKFYESEKEVGSFLFSNRQVWMLKDFLYFHYSGNEIEYKDIDLNIFDNQTKVVMCLLKSSNYMITVEDLKELGIKKNTASVMLNTLVKKGLLQECNKVGHVKLYTATIPKEELREMFVGKED